MRILSSLFVVLRSFFNLQAVIERFVAQSNDIPKPFVGAADPDKIITAVRRVPNVRSDPLSCPPLPDAGE
jgi:hypothetical protein